MNSNALVQDSKVVFNRDGAGRKPKTEIIPFPNGQRPKKRDKLVEQLIAMEWVTVHDDEEIMFVKHFFNKNTQKRRTILHLLSSPSFGTGLYVMRRSQSTFDLKEVYNPEKQKVELKLSCYDFDAFSIDAQEYATIEDMGEERFFEFLLENEFITEDELIYFNRSSVERKKIASARPEIIMDVLCAEDMPEVDEN